MVRTLEEIITAVKGIIGDNTSDEAIALLEDMTDTYNAFGDNVDWKVRYDENDNMWRKKYIERFEGGIVNEPEAEDEDTEVTINELFEEVK